MKADSIHTLIKYAEKLGYRVQRNSRYSEVLWHPSHPHNKPLSIGLRRQKNPAYEVYDMLHELGHHEIRKSWKDYRKEYPITVHAEKMHYVYGIYKYKRRIGYKLEEVREEFAAWDLGLKIARRKGVEIDLVDYRRYAYKNLMSYVRFHGGTVTP